MTEDERQEKVKTELTAVKEKILTNIIQNVKDQYYTETYYFSWSGLNLQLKLFKLKPSLCRSTQTRKRKIQLQIHERDRK